MFVVLVVVKTLVWAETVVNMLAKVSTIDVAIEELTGLMVDIGAGADMLAGVEIIVLPVVVIALEFTVTVYDALLAGKIIGVVTGVGVDLLADMKVNVLVAAMAVLEFAIPAPLYSFRCCAVFDCWPMTLSNFASVLQAWMPSYHV